MASKFTAPPFGIITIVISTIVTVSKSSPSLIYSLCQTEMAVASPVVDWSTANTLLAFGSL